MEYYVINNRKGSQRNVKRLLRIENGICEEYTYIPGQTPKWYRSDRGKKIIERNYPNYNIKSLTKESMEEFVVNINKNSDLDKANAVIREEKDNKGRLHNITYSDWARYVDSYFIEDDFDFYEMMNREDYKYFFDKYNKSLHKLSLDDNKFYEFSVYQKGKNFYKGWIETGQYSVRNLLEINNYEKILMYIDQYDDDIKNEKYEVEIEAEDML